MLKNFLNRTEGHQAQGADWRDAIPAADKTSPPPAAGLVAKVASNLARMPIDTAAKSAARAHDRMVQASGEWIKAERDLEKLRTENAEREALQQAFVERQLEAVQSAEREYDLAQARVLMECRDVGAINGKYVDFRSMSERDEEATPTVRIEPK